MDTSTIIELLRNNPAVVQAIERTSKHVRSYVVTSITIFELLVGAHLFKVKEVDDIEEFLDAYKVIPFDWESARRGSEIKAKLTLVGNQIEDKDTMIAGCMLAHGVSHVLTQNRKHFERIEDIEVLGDG